MQTPLTTEDADARIERSLIDALEQKQEGNDHFKAKEWESALAAYRLAIGLLPPGKREHRPPQTQEEEEEQKESLVTVPGSEPDMRCAKARSVLNANIAACFLKLGDSKQVVEACTEALLDDPSYVKALQRRASANERINTWSSLTQAKEDYETLLKLLTPSSPEYATTERSLRQVTPRVEAAQKRETDEMLGKLKEMGNGILGKFGLSTDNFQFEPNGQGGYSLKMSK